MSRPYLYLLVEEASREMLSRLLIARVAVARGFSVVVGPQWWFWANREALPAGVMFFKGNNTIQATQMKAARNAGHLVASIEEEALGVCDREEIVRLYDPEAVENCSSIMVHGETQRGWLVDRFPHAADRIVVTGNPRTDLMDDEVIAATRSDMISRIGEIGEFILFNTNYATFNPREGDTLRFYENCLAAGVLQAGDDADMQYFRDWCDWEKNNLEHALAFLATLEREKCPLPVVVRPHPGERLEFWQDALAGRSGFLVRREGDHIAWTSCAKMVAHTSCTTGLEAFLLDRPAVSLRSNRDEWDGKYMSNLVNHNEFEPAAAADWVLRHIRGDDDAVDDRDKAVAALDPHLRIEGLRAGVILDVLEDLIDRDGSSLSSRAGSPTHSVPVTKHQEAKFAGIDRSRVCRDLDALRGLAAGELDGGLEIKVEEGAPLVYRFQKA
ncbi:MAG: hypothetical protein HOH65_06530 [Rhodospirillaceae bacterium]|nr:hypothetical protein [Rhodospirillaceae bacterium]